MSKVNKIKYGVIPAAGEGNRMGYLSNLLSKSLFPLYDRPILHYIIDQMEKVGIEKIFIIIKTRKQGIIDYIESVRNDIKPEIVLIELDELGPLSQGILSVKKYLSEPFMTILGDDCTIVDSLDEMVEEFFEKRTIVIEGMVKEKDKRILKETCCAKLDKQGKIIEILEKPVKPLYRLRGCGVYIFDPKIFHYIKEKLKDDTENKLGITEVINLVAKEGMAYGHMLKGENININDYDELVKASLLVKKLKQNI